MAARRRQAIENGRSRWSRRRCTPARRARGRPAPAPAAAGWSPPTPRAGTTGRWRPVRMLDQRLHRGGHLQREGRPLGRDAGAALLPAWKRGCRILRAGVPAGSVWMHRPPTWNSGSTVSTVSRGEILHLRRDAHVGQQVGLRVHRGLGARWWSRGVDQQGGGASAAAWSGAAGGLGLADSDSGWAAIPLARARSQSCDQSSSCTRCAGRAVGHQLLPFGEGQAEVEWQQHRADAGQPTPAGRPGPDGWPPASPRGPRAARPSDARPRQRHGWRPARQIAGLCHGRTLNCSDGAPAAWTGKHLPQGYRAEPWRPPFT